MTWEWLKIIRLMPFMIVAYYLISGVIDGNFKAFLVFIGILFSALITIGVSKLDYVKNLIFPNPTDPDALPTNKEIVDKIKTFSMFNINAEPMSYLPLSINIYAFLLFYYIYVMFSYDKKKNMTKNTKDRRAQGYTNWWLVVALVLILLIDVGYFKYVSASNYMMILIPLVLGLVTGIVWALLIGSSNWALPTKSVNETCQPSQMSYSCKLTTNGNLIK